jgi:hypothetical protein
MVTLSTIRSDSLVNRRKANEFKPAVYLNNQIEQIRAIGHQVYQMKKDKPKSENKS